jgi:protein O-GlcNAc transferase
MIDPAEQLIVEGLKLAEADPVKALQTFRAAVQADPGLFSAHRNVGMMLAQLGRHPEAVKPLETALSLAPDDEVSARLLAGTYQVLGKLEDAVRAWRAVLRLNPAHDAGQLSLAIALETLGRFEEAAKVRRDYAQLHPTQPSAHAALGVTLHKAGQFPEAVAELDEAVRLDKQFLAQHPLEQQVYAAARAGRGS